MKTPDRPPKMDGTRTSTHKSPKTSLECRDSVREITNKFAPGGFGIVQRITNEDLAACLKELPRVSFIDVYLGANVTLKWTTRHARGNVVRNLLEEAVPPLLDETQVDQILESAIQRSDFKAIRAILNYEGYGIPLEEPNSLVLPAEMDNESFIDPKDIQIHITPEAYELWKAPLEMCEPEPSVESSAFHKTFVEVMANNVPLRLERLIRRKDVNGLRMWLRLYGHAISSGHSGDQDNSDLDMPKVSSDEPEPPQ